MAVLGATLERILERGFRGARDLSKAADPLDSELAASVLVAAWSEHELPGQPDPGSLLASAMIGYLETQVMTGAAPDAMPLLLGFRAVDRGRASVDALLAVYRLGEAGAPSPPWTDVAGRARWESAWSASDVFGDHDFLVGRFSYGGEAAHDIAVLIDHNILDIAKDVAVLRSDKDLRAEWERQPDISLRDVSRQEYADRLADALDMLDHTWDPPVSEGVRLLRPLVESRRIDLPRPKPLKRRPVSQAARDRLYKAFRGSESGQGLGRDVQLARLCIDYAADYHEDPSRWSPIVVELFLADWLPRKVSLTDEEVDRLPAVLRAWLRFVGEQRGFEERLVGELLDAVDRNEALFREAIGDSDDFGPAKSIAQLMAADGVDFSDPDAVQAWIDAFDARPLDEREEDIGDPFLH